MPSGDVRQRRPHRSDTFDDDRQLKKEDSKNFSPGWTRPFLKALLISIIALVIGFILLPSPIDPVPFELPEPPELTGALAPNEILKSAERLYSGQLNGPESIVVDGDHIYTGTSDGWLNDIYKGEVRKLVRFGKGLCGGMENEDTCGRILGLRMDKDGFLVVADSYFGLFKVNVATGDYSTLFSSANPINGKLAKFVNDLDFGPDGKIYFTHSSALWHRNKFHLIALEGDASGRLLVYDPKTETISVLMDGLFFANGVQLTKDKTAVLVTETLKARIWKYDIKSGKALVWADNLPGTPDNIRYHKLTSTYWVGLALIRQKGVSFFDVLSDKPWLRGQLAKLLPSPSYLMVLTKMFSRADTAVMAVELNESGTILRSIHDTTGEVIQGVSEIESVDGVFYLGSFSAPYLGRLYTKRVTGF